MSTPESSEGTKLAPALNAAAIDLVARRFAVLGEQMRLHLIHALFPGEQSVHDLIRETGGTQTNVSRHLQTLMHAGILTRRKEGIQVFYRLADPSIGPLCDLVCGSLKQRLSEQVGALAG
jgi:ArsR family transcriptional regulator